MAERILSSTQSFSEPDGFVDSQKTVICSCEALMDTWGAGSQKKQLSGAVMLNGLTLGA
jgi:hypothetical protein